MFTIEELKTIKYTLELAMKYVELTEEEDELNHILEVLDENINPVMHFEPECWQDFMLDAENYCGKTILIEGTTYTIGDIEDFIRDYGYDNYSQIADNLDSLITQGLLKC